jgi:parvulin-like peptidyl-prolyl isomerase
MEILADMKIIVDGIISTYEQRITAVENIVDNLYRILDDSKAERDRMEYQLKEILSAGSSLRKRDFDSMVKDIFAWHDGRRRRVRVLLGTYIKEQKDAAKKLRNTLMDKGLTGVREAVGLIQKNINIREEDITSRLNAIRGECEEMTRAFRNLLDKGEKLSHREVKETLRNIQQWQALKDGIPGQPRMRA